MSVDVKEKPLNVAVVGFGYWGPNLARNFNHNDRTKTAVICDSFPQLTE